MAIDVGIWTGDVVTHGDVDSWADASHVVAPEMYDDEKTFPLLSGIDPYGNTIFNQVQIPRFITELERRLEAFDPGPRRRSVERVLALARDCRGAHKYLVFVGD